MKDRNRRLDALGMLALAAVTLTACSGHVALESAAPAVPPEHRACNQSSDCTLVRVTCGGCDLGVAVHRAYSDLYGELARADCAAVDYPAACYQPSSAAVCRDNACVRPTP